MTNSEYLASLLTARAELYAKLYPISDDNAGGKPNSNGPVGVDHVGWRARLFEELTRVNDEIARLEAAGVTADGQDSGALYSETRGFF